MNFPRVVYAIQHNPTGKIYVGSSHRLYQRVMTHVGNLRRGEHPIPEMQKDCDAYGFNYTVYIVDVVRWIEESWKEFRWMDVLGTRDPSKGYNMRDNSKPMSLTDFEPFWVPDFWTIDDGGEAKDAFKARIENAEKLAHL